MKYLVDKDGNIQTAIFLSEIPDGFRDISDKVKIDSGAEELEALYLEALFIAEIPAVLPVDEHWTDGEHKVYDANDIPTLTDENGDPYLDPAWTHVAAVEAVDAVPAHYRVKKTSTADQELREAKMDKLRALRDPLLDEADKKINTLEDDGEDASAWRAYRKALRDITEYYKKVNGDWKVLTDSLVVEEFEFPAKPE